MAYKTILVETVAPAIAQITLNRPRVLNALNRALFGELDTALDAIAADDSVRIVILTGSGEKAFAAGADIQELAGLSGLEGQELAKSGQHVFSKLENLGRPVIAAVNGFALGGGCELAMAATMRIASETARFGQPEVKLGLIPGYGGTQRLPRLVGKPAALKLLLTGEIISAAEALRIGLVEEVVPAAELMQRAEILALSIAAQAPLAVAEILRVVDEGLDLPLEAGLQMESEHFGRLCGTTDKAEGTRAFLEKRGPAWKGE